jgi:hypothetical protein
MPVVPFSNNIGPGNLPNPDTQNWVDDAAYQHDLRYSQAKTGDEIRGADRDFLLDLTGKFDPNPLHSIHQALGVAGIGAKYAFESVAGVQYPSLTMPPTQQPMEIDMQGATEAENQIVPPPAKAAKGGKRKKGELKTAEVAEETDSKKMKGGEDSEAVASHGAGSKNHLDILSHPVNNITGLSPWKTQKTFDLEIVTFNPNFKVVNGTNPIGLWPAPCYSFAIEQLGWYLNQGEVNWLNALNGTSQTVTKVSGSISLGILNSPFITQTSSSNQTSANTNVNVTLYSGTGLEDNYILFNGLGTTDYASATGDYPLTAWTSGLYDPAKLTDCSFTGATPVLPATQVTRSFNQIVAFPTQVTVTSSTATISNTLAPPVYKDKMTKIVESTAGGMLNTWEYSPNFSFCLQNTPSSQFNATMTLGVDAQPTSLLAANTTTSPSNLGLTNEAGNESLISLTSAIMQDNNVHFHGRGKRPRLMPSPTILPREYIAFLPPTTVGGGSVQPIKIQIQVKTEIEVMIKIDNTYSTNASCVPYGAAVSWPSAAVGNVARYNNVKFLGSTDNWAGNCGMKIVNT